MSYVLKGVYLKTDGEGKMERNVYLNKSRGGQKNGKGGTPVDLFKPKAVAEGATTVSTQFSVAPELTDAEKEKKKAQRKAQKAARKLNR